MTKAELTKKLAEVANLSAKDAKQVLDAVFDVLKDAIKQDGQQAIQGFGVFKIKQRAAREGRNPHTGEKISIPAVNSVTFKPAPSYKATLNPEAAKKTTKADTKADAKAAKAPAKKSSKKSK